jgi:hypothetical protein
MLVFIWDVQNHFQVMSHGCIAALLQRFVHTCHTCWALVPSACSCNLPRLLTCEAVTIGKQVNIGKSSANMESFNVITRYCCSHSLGAAWHAAVGQNHRLCRYTSKYIVNWCVLAVRNITGLFPYVTTLDSWRTEALTVAAGCATAAVTAAVGCWGRCRQRDRAALTIQREVDHVSDG